MHADKSGRVTSIETNCISRKEQHLESTVGGVRPPISVFPSMSLQVLRQHVAEDSHAGGYLCRVSFGTVAVSPSVLGSNASIAFDTEPL